MAEVTTEAYQDLRDYIEDNWDYIEFRDDADNPVVRLGVSDPRIEWSHTAGDQELEITAVLRGDDGDITTPQTISKSLIFKQDTGGDPLSVEELTEFTIEQDDDELTVKHKIQVPQIV